MTQRIISYNINGIRAAQRKGITDWLAEEQFDIVCFQETKAHPEQVDMTDFEKTGYHHFWHSATSKKGYSGVATLSLREPDKVVVGCGMDKYDREGRILRTDFGEITLLNCYFPSGTTGDVRQDFKMEFLDDFFQWIRELRKERPKLIVVGDYNIAHTEMDIHDPVRNKKNSGFLPEEREWLSKWFESGFTDAFRHQYPERQQYSWWTYRANARANNKGWRIDYQSVTDNLRDQVKDAYQLTDIVHSDHCPVYLELDWPS
jgi:exodeoxyribonuclease III